MGEHRELHLGREAGFELEHDGLSRDLLLLVVVLDLGVLGDDRRILLAAVHGVRNQFPILQLEDLEWRSATERGRVSLSIEGCSPPLTPLDVMRLGRFLTRMIR